MVGIFLHSVTFGGQCEGAACVSGIKMECSEIIAWFRLDSGTNQFKAGNRYTTHFYCLVVETGFYSYVVECLPLDPTAQVRFPPRAVGIFLHPVTFYVVGIGI